MILFYAQRFLNIYLHGKLYFNEVKKMEIGQTISQGVIIVTVAEWLDSASSENFLKYCTALPVSPVIIDLSGLTYISSAGIRALLQFEKDRRQQGITVAIVGSKGFVLSVLKMSGFDQIFLMYPSVTEAMQVMAKR